MRHKDVRTVRLSGLEPDEDIKIRFTGIRPGEKLREELFTDREKMAATRHSRILIARNGEGDGEVPTFLNEKISFCDQGNF